MQRKPLIILTTVLLITFLALCLVACNPLQDELFAEVTAKLKNFGAMVEKSNSYTYSVQMTLDDYVGKQCIKKMQSPYYLENSLSYNAPAQLEKLIREENGQIYGYTLKRDNYYKRELVEDINSDENKFDVSFLFDSTLKQKARNITCKNNEYAITTHYNDIECQYLKYLLDLSLEENESEALHNSVLTLKIKISETKTVVSFKTVLNLGADTKPNSKNLDFCVTVDLSDFKQLDFDNSDYKVLNATSIDEVYKLTDITKPLECDAHDNVFKVELEKGLYYIEYESTPYVTIRSADDLNDIIDFGIIPDDVYDLDSIYNYCFNVEKSGQYYFIFEYCENQTYEIVHCDYDDLYEIDNPKVLQENTVGTIEGKYDLEYYAYTNENEGLLTITNTSNTAIDIIYKSAPPFYAYNQLSLAKGETLKNIYVGKNGTTLFVCKPDATEPVNYSLTASFYYNNNGLNKDFDKMPWITSEFSEEYYAVGCGLSGKSLRLHVDTKGLYKFEFENLYEGLSDEVTVNVYDTEGNNVGYKYDALEPGDYEVYISNYSSNLSIVKVKCVLVKPAEDFEINVTLNTVSFAEINTEKARIEQIKVADNQIVKYCFTLSEDCLVMYSDYLYIFDADDKPLTFGVSDMGAIKLKAGNYYYICYDLFGNPVQIAIVTDYEGSVIDYGNMQTLTLDTNITYDDNALKTCYAVLEIDHDGLYYFEPNNSYIMQVFVYDEGLNAVPTINRDSYIYELKAGMYYINAEYYASNGIFVILKEAQA